MIFVDMLDDAMHNGSELEIQTKSRGIIIGTPDAVDEFDSDPERLGYYLAIGKHGAGTVFIDEIVDIKVIPRADTTMRAVV
ncbi:MAG: hypothetical protein LBC82_09910 [Oscillospiraceae bacterium]|jgi:hypothetical protein|nr:hypothetical protein [Oscillospiraceae bacterium]